MNLTPIVTKNKRTSNALLRDISRRSSLNRIYEKKSLELLKKSIEARSKTYNALSKRDKGGGGLLRNLIGGSLLSRRLRGRGGAGGLGSGGIRPKLPKGGGTIGGGVGRFGRFGRIGPLAILGTGLDFAGRKAGGQTNLQAGIGAGGGLAGALAGGKIGAAIGTAILPGVGTVAGGLLGSGIGALAGGSIADTLTGLGSDTRRQLQTNIQKKRADKTLFSGALDKFDGTLKTLETDTAPTLMAFKKFGRSDGEGGRLPTTTPKQPFFTAGRIADIVFLTLELGLLAVAVASPFDAVAGDAVAAGVVARRLAKLKILNRSSKFLDFSKTASNITKQTKQAEVARNLFKKKIRSRITSNREIFAGSQLTNFFKDLKFAESLPGMSRGGRLKLLGDRTLADILGAKSMVGRDRGIRIFEKLSKSNKATESLDDMIENSIMRDRLEELGDATRIEEKVRKLWKFELPKVLKTRMIESPQQQEAARTFLDFITDNYLSTLSDTSTPEDLTRLIRSPVGEVIKDYTKLKKLQKLPENKGRKFLDTDTLSGFFQRIPADELEQFTAVPIKKFAEGGRVEAGTPYIVGEVGKELFVPDVSGDIIPNDQLGPAIIAMTSDPDTIMQSSGGGGNSGGGIVIVPASPYDVVTKYAQMTGLFTV